MAKSIKEFITCICNRSLQDTQVFTKDKDKIIFKGIFSYAEFSINADDLPKPNKSGEMLDIDVGEDFNFSDYADSNWVIKVKDTKLKKQIEKIIEEGADIFELNELGFENTDGQYDVVPTEPDSFIIVGDEVGTDQADKIEELKSRGVFLLDSEDSANVSEAIEVLSKAAELQATVDVSNINLQFIKTSLAKAHKLAGDFEKALKIYEEVKDAYIQMEGKYSSGASWINSLISDLFLSLNKFDEAIFYKEHTLLFDAYPPRMVDFAKLLSLANRKLDANGVLSNALSKLNFDQYGDKARIELEMFELLVTETGKHEEALEVLKKATLSATLSRDGDLLKECKQAEKRLKKK
jgi:tetratricopeptide (TPR) repeat protein